MNEQLQSALALLIGKTTEGLAEGTEFLVAELPDVVYQLMMWYGVKSAIASTIVLLLVSLYLYGEKRTFEVARANPDGDAVVIGWGIVGMMIRLPVLIILHSNFSLEWLQILIAPKIWLIEYAATLVK